MTLPGRADQPVLLHGIDDLLEAQDVRLKGGHVGQDQGQSLRPAIGQIQDVEGRDMHSIHGSSSHVVGASAIGSANRNVEPTPSSESTQIRPPCCSTT